MRFIKSDGSIESMQDLSAIPVCPDTKKHEVIIHCMDEDTGESTIYVGKYDQYGNVDWKETKNTTMQWTVRSLDNNE